MGQLALSPSPVSCVSSHPQFPGDSSPLRLAGEVLMLPCPIAPSQADCCGGRRHQHDPCLSSCALLSTHTSGQGTATYMGWLSFSPGLLGFLVFSPARGINKGKDVGLLCWTSSCWLWNDKMQCNSVFSWLFFFSFLNSDARWHCSLRLCVPWRILVLIPSPLGIDQENDISILSG